MEAYFHNNPRIQEWINQILEHIFTACILTGVDSEVEFEKGCEIVIKLTSLLQEIPTLPSDFLADGVKQLLEQQLPDARVINNLPTFQPLMDRMLREGILKVSATPIKEEVSHLEFVYNSEIPALAHAHAQAESDTQALADALAKVETQAKAHILALDEALAKAYAEALAEALSHAEMQAEALALADALAHAEMQAKTNQMNLLKHVLSNVFPKGTVYWNKSLMGQTFLAQVEDILICVHDHEHPCNLKKYNKDGWKVLVCSSENLTFPRRLERELKQIQRSAGTMTMLN